MSEAKTDFENVNDDNENPAWATLSGWTETGRGLNQLFIGSTLIAIGILVSLLGTFLSPMIANSVGWGMDSQMVVVVIGSLASLPGMILQIMGIVGFSHVPKEIHTSNLIRKALICGVIALVLTLLILSMLFWGNRILYLAQFLNLINIIFCIPYLADALSIVALILLLLSLQRTSQYIGEFTAISNTNVVRGIFLLNLALKMLFIFNWFFMMGRMNQILSSILEFLSLGLAIVGLFMFIGMVKRLRDAINMGLNKDSPSNNPYGS